MSDQQPTPLPEPTAGGSYTRDPVTGELTLVERTGERKPRDKRESDAPADEAAKAGADPAAADEAAAGEPTQE